MALVSPRCGSCNYLHLSHLHSVLPRKHLWLRNLSVASKLFAVSSGNLVCSDNYFQGSALLIVDEQPGSTLFPMEWLLGLPEGSRAKRCPGSGPLRVSRVSVPPPNQVLLFDISGPDWPRRGRLSSFAPLAIQASCCSSVSNRLYFLEASPKRSRQHCCLAVRG